ncbi:hypothetical protein K3495_g4256 [Podosphaera aphanis]|nr:hypothetical protein K3495_g4256 [Podosphaera aphanis]
MSRDGTSITKSHPGYNSHVPFGGERVRSRAITFFRKELRAYQIFPTERTADYCFVQISGITFVNVYRAPGPTGTLEPLLRWQPPGPTVVGGDFNAVSQLWQPQAQRYNASALASVKPFYHCTSDYFTIEGTVYTPGKSDLTGIVSEVRVSDANLDDFARCAERWAKLGQFKTVGDVERCTARLLEALHDAVRVTRQAPATESGRTAPWWNDNCKDKWREYKESKNLVENSATAGKAFRKAVKAAKRECWIKQIEASESEAQAYKLIRWAKPRPAKEPPPFQVSPDRWLSDPPNSRFGYADDIAIIRTGKDPGEAIAAAQHEVDRLVELAAEHKIDFDPAKSELLVIGGGPRKKITTSDLFINIKSQRIEPSAHIRWLGVWIDSQLSFKYHVQQWCGKALKLEQFLRQINKVQHGAALGPLIRAVQSCIVSTAIIQIGIWI